MNKSIFICILVTSMKINFVIYYNAKLYGDSEMTNTE